MSRTKRGKEIIKAEIQNVKSQTPARVRQIRRKQGKEAAEKAKIAIALGRAESRGVKT